MGSPEKGLLRRIFAAAKSFTKHLNEIDKNSAHDDEQDIVNRAKQAQSAFIARQIRKSPDFIKENYKKHLSTDVAQEGWNNNKPMYGSNLTPRLKDVFKKHGWKMALSPVMPLLWSEIASDFGRAIADSYNESHSPEYKNKDSGPAKLNKNFKPNPAYKAKLKASTSMETGRSTTRAIFNFSTMYFSKAGIKETAIAIALAYATLKLTAAGVDALVEFSYWNKDWKNLLVDTGQVASGIRDQIVTELYGDDPSKYPAKEVIDQAVAEQVYNSDKLNDNKGQFGTAVGVDFPIILGKFMACVIPAYVCGAHLVQRWRAWTTGKITNEWLKYKSAFKIKHAYTNIDNPDQRIQEDIDKITEFGVDMATEGLETGLTLASFFPILYAMGSINPAWFGGPDVQIDGFMTYGAALYAALGTGALAYLARNRPEITRHKKRAEGNFRANLNSNHNQAEQVGLAGGEERERDVLKEQFRDVNAATGRNIRNITGIKMFSTAHSNMGGLITPYFVAAPLYFSSIMDFGTMDQAAGIFRRVENGFAFIQNKIPQIAEVQASFMRLGQVMDAIELTKYEEQERLYYAKMRENSQTPKPATPSA